MHFRIADTFTTALAKLTNQEQKSVKTTVFDLQMDPTGNGLRLHKLTGGRDKNFWSVSASMDIRIIVHRSGESILVCYVDHHDKAYAWAADRKLEVHPQTGAAQLVEVAQVEREIIVPVYVNQHVHNKITGTEKKAPPLADKDGSWLMLYGVPEEWIERVKQASEDELLVIADHLPGEAAEAIIDIAAGNTPPIPIQLDPIENDPFEHPDAQRRFRTIETSEELAAALDAPWDKWTIFLHPSQRETVSKTFSGPARVSGSAGTGKTVVALHRAVNLVRNDENVTVLLTTFSKALAAALQRNLNRLLKHEPILGERIRVADLNSIGRKLFLARNPGAKIVDRDWQEETLLEAAELVEHDFSLGFLRNEWLNVVDPWQIRSAEAYKNVKRIGRRKRLPETRREIAWAIFADVFEQMDKENYVTQAGVFQSLADLFTKAAERTPFDYVVVDEAQDISVSQLRFLAAVIGDKPNGLFFAGDLGQRIFQTPFSWSSLGVDVRGRASTLRINYRTSHQIRSQADLLLSSQIEDMDGNKESRSNTQSVFNGPRPVIRVFDSVEEEIKEVSEWISNKLSEGVNAGEIAVFVRSTAELLRGRQAIELTGQSICELNENLSLKSSSVVLSTMHLAKGLEFKAVVVMACDEGVLPDQERLEDVADMAEVEEIYETERHLLYVACTRARDFLMISAAVEGSEFIEDLLQ